MKGKIRNEKRENNVPIKRTKANETSWLLMENLILPGEHTDDDLVERNP